MSGIPAGAGQLLGKRLGKYEILALLALGGTAEIYLARIAGAAGFEKYVVVKCLHDHLADDAEFVKMFLDEARLAAHLDHSNIVQTMELSDHEGRYYMVMEFLAGLSLAMIVRRATERLQSTRIPVPLVLNILAQAAAGLHYAHEKAMNGRALNIVHRDISPQNLVICFEGVVKLVDFGIAKAELRETRTRSGTIKGKFAYMSPEQCVANNVDRRTDVFALGVIGHELLTGHRLFKRPSPYETYQAVMECDVKPPSVVEPTLDPALDPVIMRAITKQRDDRYPTAEAFGDALLSFLHHRGFGSGQGDVARFFDAHFAQEIEEHSGRMRELVSGRDVSIDTGVSWGTDDGRDSDPSLSGVSAASSTELTAARRQAAGSLSFVLEGLNSGGSRGEADDELPAERTRIETNPLERFNEMERMGRGGGNPDGPTQLAPSSAVPVPAPPPMEAARAAAVPRAAGPASARFPDPSNLPTVIGGADPRTMIAAEPPTAPPGPPLPSILGAGAPGSLPAHARTQIAPMPVSGGPAAGGAAGNGALPRVPPQGKSPRPPASASSPPAAYPVMNAELREQIATGASVFPSELRGGTPHPGQPPARAPGPGMPGPGMPGHGSSGPGMSGPGMQGHGSPGPGTQGYGSSGPGTSGPGMQGHGSPGPGMPGPGMQGHGSSGPGMPGPGMQGHGSSGPGMPGPGMQGYGSSGPGMPGPGMQGYGSSGPGMPGPGMQGHGSSGPGMPGPGMQGHGSSGPGMPGPGMQGHGSSGPGMPGPGMQGHGSSGSGMPGPGMQGYGSSGSGMPGPGMQGHGSSGPGMSGPGMSGAGMPESGMPGSGAPPARGSDPAPMSGGYPMPDGAMFDPARAAELMSPVGQQYPENVDWNAAAAGPARAVPPWLLAALFIGAIGIALLLTVVVARLIH